MEEQLGHLTSFELPGERPASAEARHKLHASIACRMVIAAPKGGQLRYIFGAAKQQAPFAVRAILPYWVGLKCMWLTPGLVWEAAAATFRASLSHASLWLGTTSETGARHDRRLTAQEIQELSL